MNQPLQAEQIQDAARFSNFAQKFKMIVWSKMPITASESELDEIALELWEWLKK